VGWGGDRWELWVRGPAAIVLICTVWDSSQDATEFDEAVPDGRRIHHAVAGDAVALVAGDVKTKAARRLLARLQTSCAVPPESVE
jgi:hypothetical protein